MKCAVEDCRRIHFAKGYCKKHYERNRLTGSPHRPKPTTEQRFFSLVQKTPGCWYWVGMKDQDGYGKFRPVRSRKIAAHRFSWELLHGPIPDGLQMDHLCRVRHCVNPEHLEPVTPRVNTLRGYGPAALNARKERCKRDHEPEWWINARGHRVCRECMREATRQWRARKRAERGS